MIFCKTTLTRRSPSRSVKYIIAKWRNSKQTLYPNKESKRQITLYQCNQIPLRSYKCYVNRDWSSLKNFRPFQGYGSTLERRNQVLNRTKKTHAEKKEKRSSKFSSRILESWGTRVFLPLSRNWIRVRVQGRRTPDIPPSPTKHFLSLFLPQNFLGSGYLVRKGQWVILLAMYFWVELPQYLQCQSAWPRA